MRNAQIYLEEHKQERKNPRSIVYWPAYERENFRKEGSA